MTTFSDLNIGDRFIICTINRVVFVKKTEERAVQEGTEKSIRVSGSQHVFRNVVEKWEGECY